MQANRMVGRRVLQHDIGHEINAMFLGGGDFSARVHASRASEREHSRGSSRDRSREHSRERTSKQRPSKHSSSMEHSRNSSSRERSSREHSRERSSKHGSREHSRDRSSEHANRDSGHVMEALIKEEAGKHLQESKRRMSYREFRRTQSDDSEASRSVLLSPLLISLFASGLSPLLHEHCRPAQLS